jgi:hypothetical protein
VSHLEGKTLVRERAESGRGGLPCPGAERKREGEGSGGPGQGEGAGKPRGGMEEGPSAFTQRGGGGVWTAGRGTPVREAGGSRERRGMGH